MSWQFIFILCASLLFIFLWMRKKFIEIDLIRLTKLTKWSGKYSKSARELLDATDEFPASVLDGLRFWNAATADPAMPLIFVTALEMGKLKRRNGETISNKSITEEERLFFAQNRELHEKYIEVTTSALMTISYSHWFWGPMLRISITDFFAENEQKKIESFSREIQKKVKTKDHPRIASELFASA